MDFELTSEQKLLRDTVRSFCKQKSPILRFRELRDTRQSWDRDVWAHMGELGWLSVPLPESVGGFGGSFVDVAIVLESWGTTLVPEPYIPSVVLGGMAIAEAGDTSQHTRWLGDLMDGRTSLCLAHAERTNRFATGDVQTSAVRVGSGWKLTGRKHFVLNGHKADHLVVTATTPDGLGLFVLDRDASGLGITEVRTIDGHGAAMLDLAATIPDDRRLGALGAPALAVVERVLDYGAAAACAEALGVCQAALDLTREHLGTREQFGVPIGSFQALQHRAVDMFVQLELMRSMSILASIRATHVAPHERARAVSAAKAHIGRSGRFITQQAIQLHGGIGITDEHDIGLYFKRMHVLGVLFGDEAHHVGRFAALANHDET